MYTSRNSQRESQVLNVEVNTIGSHSFDFVAQSTTILDKI